MDDTDMELIESFCEMSIRCGTPSDTIYAFLSMCQNASTGQDLMDIAATYYDLSQRYVIGVKEIYNRYIGWALPSKKACQLVVNTWKRQPSARVIDMGAGTGLFCRVFHHLGIPENRLLAVDLPNPSHTSVLNKNFWPIHYGAFEVGEDDILFIAWGVDRSVIEDYVANGGQWVIILGEIDGGCTVPADFFNDHVDWEVELHTVDGPASLWCERLSINRRLW
jgi:hypothetical protein